MSAPTIKPPRTGSKFIPATLSQDFIASIVVFLVAVPLCMGIAIASGVPAEKGLVTGIIGGIIVGTLAGAPLLVSGPAAGLAVIVYDLVQDHGITALGPILIVAGLVQVVAGLFKLGQWFRAISPAVVHGLLAGIGVLIVASQAHIMIDQTTLPSGIRNILGAPARYLALSPTAFGPTEQAFLVGAITILTILLWEKFRPKSLKLVPGALLGVIIATALTAIMALSIKKVVVPDSLVASLAFPNPADFGVLASPTILLTAVALAFIASAETLLAAVAVDKMQDGTRAKFDKELIAQGFGNALCGFVGALPMTGVIVRSSANVQAGAKTRWSAILHGVWILGFVALLPWLMRLIPMACLAGILIVVGWKLVSLKHVRHLHKLYGVLPVIVWAATLIMVVSTDLLLGVLTGIALSLLELIPFVRNLSLLIQQRGTAEEPELELAGTATLFHLPRLAKALDGLPERGTVRLVFKGLANVDHTCSELISDWLQRRKAAGGHTEIDGEGAALHRQFAEAAA